ncbi:MAG: GNAT family N-acetyltransferase [Streptosporangiaceae bacterium]
MAAGPTSPDNDVVLAVRRLAAADVPAVTRIVRGLPDYFTSDVPGQVERDAGDHDGWAVTDSGEVAGFAVVARRSPGGAEILWLAVDRARRGHGLGTVLVDRVLGELATDGVSVVEAKTLDRSAGYQPYEATRAFWEHRGFVQVDTIDPLPGWPPGNPAAIYIAALRPTR